jgi:hypothetical protein
MAAIAFHARCTCWVKDRPAEQQFGIRRGAHSPTCPEYRQSGDAVDRDADEALREWYCPDPQTAELQLHRQECRAIDGKMDE